MSVYVDPSILVSFFANDDLAPRADRFFQGSPGPLLVSDLAGAEFASAISRLVRMRELGAPTARRVLVDFDAWVARGVDWLAMTEDLPREENKVTIESDGRIRLHYKSNNLAAHRELVDETKRMLGELGFWIVMSHSHQSKNTTHQCGTLVFGTDPREAVLDTYCRTHDVENLFVVDASFFPSSAAVNPGLTIVAQAIRSADHIKSTRL